MQAWKAHRYGPALAGLEHEHVALQDHLLTELGESVPWQGCVPMLVK